MAPPAPLMPAYTPSARLRGGPIGKVVAISASAVGAASAPPAPCRARARQQPPLRGGEAAEQRPDREDEDAGDEDAAAAEDVAEPAAEQQQAAEGQRVGGDDPLEAAAAEAERLLDVRQRDVHDRRVEHDHQLRRRDDGQREAEVTRDVCAGFGRRPGRHRLARRLHNV